MRVIWERTQLLPNGSTAVKQIPFLNVARSLGDFWSYNPQTDKYVVSPEPDVYVIPLNLNVHRFVVIASDGLWNVMSPNDVVSFIHENQSKNVVSALICEALQRWYNKRKLADNIAVLIVFLK